MDYSFSGNDAQIVIRLSGRLTLVDNAKFRGLLEEMKNRKPSSCQVDCPCFGPKPSSLDEKRLQPFFLS
jgi:hypothetical protein